MPTWDLVIVGAGPAGSTTALAALHPDPSLRILLLDRADPQPEPDRPSRPPSRPQPHPVPIFEER